MQDKPDHSLEDATPTPPKAGFPRVPMPYILFGACAIPIAVGILMMNLGSETIVAFGMAIGAPAVIGAVVLPFVCQMRDK